MPNPAQEAANRLVDTHERHYGAIKGCSSLRGLLEHALTEARSAALKEAAEMAKREAEDYDHDDQEGRYDHSPSCPKCRFGWLASELDRMAGGAEDTSTEKEGDGGN